MKAARALTLDAFLPAQRGLRAKSGDGGIRRRFVNDSAISIGDAQDTKAPARGEPAGAVLRWSRRQGCKRRFDPVSGRSDPRLPL